MKFKTLLLILSLVNAAFGLYTLHTPFVWIFIVFAFVLMTLANSAVMGKYKWYRWLYGGTWVRLYFDYFDPEWWPKERAERRGYLDKVTTEESYE